MSHRPCGSGKQLQACAILENTVLILVSLGLGKKRRCDSGCFQLDRVRPDHTSNTRVDGGAETEVRPGKQEYGHHRARGIGSGYSPVIVGK